MQEEIIIDAVEVGKRLGWHPMTVLSWARQGKIPSIRISSKTIRFDWAEVCVALREQSPNKVKYSKTKCKWSYKEKKNGI